MTHARAIGRAALLAASLAAALPASAQRLDAATLRQFAGRYKADCTNPAAAQLRVTPDALLIEQGGQRMTGRKPVSAYSYFGNSPAPKNFQVALISEVRGGPQLLFMAYADAAGAYILLDGDPKVTAALGHALMAARYRRCGAPAAAVPELGTLAADPTFKRLYLRALGPKASERWLARFEGPAPPTREQEFDGTRYVVVAICKAHDCYDHNAVLLYSAAQQRLVGLVQQRGVKTLLGAPGPSLAPQLERLWLHEWRQK